MYRILPYMLLFVAVVLLQIFLFDNLMISIYLNPLIYIAFILLLPMDTPSWALLLLGLFTGMTMDAVMGIAGLNTLTTLPVAFIRPRLLGMFLNREEEREGGVPSVERMGAHKFVEYIVLAVIVHHTVFFLLEALSYNYLIHTILRIVLSSSVTILFVWLIARVFTANSARQ